MNIFKKNADPDSVALWKKEYKRLEQERNAAYAELESIKDYKQQYKDLIDEVSQLKDKYTKLIQQVESIGDEYKKKLQAIVDKK